MYALERNFFQNGQISSKNFDSYVDDTKKTIVTDKATPGDVMVVSEIFAKMASVEDATSEVSELRKLIQL